MNHDEITKCNSQFKTKNGNTHKIWISRDENNVFILVDNEIVGTFRDTKSGDYELVLGHRPTY